MRKLALWFMLTSSPALCSSPRYPVSRVTDHVDTYHGVSVADPFRWLEDLDAPETAAWVGAENAVTEAFLRTLPERQVLRERLTDLYNYARYSLPEKRGHRYFYTYNPGLQNQSPLYVKERLTDDGRLLLDPNTLSADGTVALSDYTPSPDGHWLAYGLATAGSDWNTFRIRNVETGIDLPEALQWVKFSGMSWTRDSAGFFYARFPAPDTATDATFSQLADQTVYYHRVGTPQSEDRRFFALPEHPKWGLLADVTEDGRYIVIAIREGTDPRRRLRLLDLQSPAEPDLDGPIVTLVDEQEASYTLIGNAGATLFFTTSLDAPNQRIIAIDANQPDREHWRTIVPEDSDVIESAGIVGGVVVVQKMRDARSVLMRYALDGRALGEIELPGLGKVAGFTGRADDPELFFSFTSFVYPTTNFRADVTSGQATVFQAPELKFDLTRYETRQVFYASKDGTRIPMFITLRKGLQLDGSHPTLLYGYGGFNVSMLPSYSSSVVAWLELGGVYAQPNLRGGGEYGKAWHLAGTKERKQNVFDDFAAAGDYLVAEGYTSHAHLALRGGSNGGLLVAATLLQRPDLARAALPGVGVLDMLRYQKFTIGWAWVSDYGASEDPAAFDYLRAYSPVHNVVAGFNYPAVLVTTGDHDDRVHPAHSFKFTAAMQTANPDARYPTYIRVETRAGHGAGKPTAKVIDQLADELAFAYHFTQTNPD